MGKLRCMLKMKAVRLVNMSTVQHEDVSRDHDNERVDDPTGVFISCSTGPITCMSLSDEGILPL